MGEERAQAGSLQKPSKRIRTARALGIVTAVFSVLGFLSLVFNTILVGTSIPELLADPAFLAEAEDSGIVSLVAAVGFSGLSSAEAVAAVFTLVALFPGFDALTCLVSLAASIGMVRSVKNPQLRRRCFGLGLVSGITSLLTLRFVTGTLLVIESVLVHMQHVEDEGGSQAYYADGKHIGFMRFVEFACIAEIIVNVTLLLFITKSESYDGAWWINFVMLLMMAVTLWIIWNRKSHGREIILAMVSVYLVINLVYYVSMGTFDPFTFMINAFWPIVMLVYFGFPSRLATPFRVRSSWKRALRNLRPKVSCGTRRALRFGATWCCTSAYSALWAIGWNGACAGLSAGALFPARTIRIPVFGTTC